MCCWCKERIDDVEKSEPVSRGGARPASERETLRPPAPCGTEGEKEATEEGMAPKHCKRGHKRTEENTYWNRNKNMKSGRYRVCRRCVIDQARRRANTQVRPGDPLPPRNAKRTGGTCRYGHRWPRWLDISSSGATCLVCRRQRAYEWRMQKRGGKVPRRKEA